MEEVWRHDEITVKQVMEALNRKAKPPRAYTTYMTVMRRLNDKGLLGRRRTGRQDTYQGLGGARNATFSVDRDTGATTSVGRKRLIALSSDRDVYDERLWMKVANLTGAAGNSTALVGTPEQVAEAMLRYYDLGITTLLLKGFDPLADVIEFGKELVPLVRQGVSARDALGAG